MEMVPPKFGLMRLPLRAAAFVALVCVAIVGSTGWTEWASRDAELRNAEVELGNLARSLTQHAEDTVEVADAILVGVVGRLETAGATPERIAGIQTTLNARIGELGRIRGVYVYDEGGRWLAATLPLNPTHPAINDREYFLHHEQSTDRGVFIGRPIRSRTFGQWIVTLSRRWNHADGTFGGVVLATVDASYFSDYYSQFNIGANATITLLNGDGFALARSPDMDSAVGRNFSEGPFLTSIHSVAPSGVSYFRSALDTVRRLGVYQRSGRYPLMLLATRSQADVLARWRHNASARIALVLGLVVLIAVIGVNMVRQLLRGQRMAAALAAKEANFRVLAEGSSDMVTRIGRDERVYYASPSSVRILGWGPEQLVGTSALAGVDPEDLPRVEQTVAALKRGEAEETRITYRTHHRDKSEIWVESTLRVTRTVDGVFDGVVVITRDVTQQKNLEGKLETLATEDGLTGISNRRRFDERLLEEWGRACRERTPLALLMIDLDHFKKYNDEYGHLAGDECLRAVARVLAAEAKRTTDLAARYGGEEFALLLPNTDAAGCERIGQRVLSEIRKACIPHRLNLPSGLVTASIGGAVLRPGAGRSANQASLIEAADRALYAAKDGGRDQLVMAARTFRQLLDRSLAG